MYKIPTSVIHMETSVGKEQQHIGLGWVDVALAGCVWAWLGECGLGSVGVAFGSVRVAFGLVGVALAQ